MFDLRPHETTRMSLGHQPFLRLVLTCLKELDGDPKDKKDNSNKPDREEQVHESSILEV